MKDYVIITDSTTDLLPEIADKFSLTVLPLTFIIDGKEYANYLDERELKSGDFYQKLRSGKMSSTSQIPVNVFMEAIEPCLKKGQDVLLISFSSSLSGSYNSLCLAKSMLEETYTDARIIAIDSKCASMGEGLLVYNACMLKQQGKSIDEVANWIEKNKFKLHHWFTVDDIDHLKRGGRLTGAAAFVAKTLKIKPVLHMNNAGQLVTKKKVFGRNKSIELLFERAKEFYVNDEEQYIFISHADCIDDARKLEEMLKKELKFKEIIIGSIGPVIGAHSGPGTLALFFFAKEEGR